MASVRAVLRDQQRALRILIAVLVVGTAVFIGVGLFWWQVLDQPLSHVSRDPAAVTGQPILLGALSSLGSVVWAAGAGAALVGGLAGSGRWRALLLQGGALTSWLILDDLYEIHDEVLPSVGVPDIVTYVLVGGAAVVWAWVNRAVIRESAWLVLATAIVMFGGSIAVDLFLETRGAATFAEDGMKFLGILAWTTYLVGCSLSAIGSSVGPASDREASVRS